MLLTFLLTVQVLGREQYFELQTSLTVTEFPEDQDRKVMSLVQSRRTHGLKAKRAEAFWALSTLKLALAQGISYNRPHVRRYALAQRH